MTQACPPSLRDRLPRRECYPIGRQGLDAVLAAAGVSGAGLTSIGFCRGDPSWPEGQGTVVEVYFAAATRDGRERVELRIYAVPARLKRRITAALDAGGLRDAVDWIAAIGPAGNAWRASDHRLVVRWSGADLRVDTFAGAAARPS